MGLYRQEYWSGLPFPPPGNLPDQGTEPRFLMSPALAGRFFSTSAPWEAPKVPLDNVLIFLSTFKRIVYSIYSFLCSFFSTDTPHFLSDIIALFFCRTSFSNLVRNTQVPVVHPRPTFTPMCLSRTPEFCLRL